MLKIGRPPLPIVFVFRRAQHVVGLHAVVDKREDAQNRPPSTSVASTVSGKMDTSLRFSGDSRTLRIHAKQKLPLHSEARLQAHGELDTKLGGPTYFCALIRRFFPDISGSFGVGIQYTKREKIRYVVRGKKSFQVTTDGYVNFNIKGRCDVDQQFKQTKSRGGAEFCWDILNFQKDQDVRLKVGYEVSEKVPYVQIRENNWTLNADMKGRWNVRYDL